jgi:uncharacterized cupin superfamily protein
VPNLFDPDFDAEQDEPGFRWRRARLGRQAGAERLGASLFEIPPREAAFPYHFHFGNEELLIVITGQPTLRGADGGWRELRAGDVVSFPIGERGAHQVVNRSDAPARILMLSEMHGPDVVVMPDSGKVQARENPPGAQEPGLWHVSRSTDAVGYFEDEPPPDA